MPSESLDPTPSTEGSGRGTQALRRHVAAIADLGRKAVSGARIEELFDDACALVAAALAVECVAIIEAVGDELVLCAASGWPDLDAVGRRAPRSGPSQAAFTLDSDDDVVLLNPAEETRFSVSGAMREYGIVSGVSVPIRGPSTAFGVLAAHTRESRVFSEDDTTFLRLVANVVAAAVEAARMIEAANDEERLLSTLIDHSPDIVIRFDRELRHLYASSAVTAVTGARPEQLIGRTIDEVGAPAHLCAVWRSELQPIFDDGEPRRFEFEFSGPNGSHWFESNAVAERAPTGEVATVVVFTRDRTDAHRVELARAASDARYRELFELATEMIFIFDADGLLVDANPAVEAALGFSRSELIGTRFETLAPSVAAPDAALPPMLYESELTTKTGERIPIQGSSRSIMRNGKVAGVLALARDISEQRTTQAELRESEALHSAVVESSRDLITVLDPDGTIRLISRSVHDILGYTQEDLVGSRFADLAHADDFTAAVESLVAATRGKEPSIAQTRAIAKNGAVRMLEGKVSAVLDAKGKPTFLVSNSRDVTERISLEEQLRQAQKMEAIGKLAGGVAHDFNNLLTAINGYSDLALESLPAEENDVRHSLEEIRRAGERAAELTRQLLAFSRRQVLRPEPVQLSSIIEGYLAIFERLVGEDVTVLTKLDPRLPTVHADPGQLGQVLLNLVVNARDAMPQGGELRIETAIVEIDREDPDGAPPVRYVTLTVSDTGLGMDELTKQRAFEPFFTTKEPGKGTGMGLSTVHGIVVQSGGTIVVRSKPNEGSSFRVYLPVAGQPALVEPTAPTLSGRVDDATILIVEDEPLVRGIMQEMLESLGYRVLSAAEPKEAIAIAESSETFDLVLTDVVMPEMNGHELALRLVELRPGLPILYTSGYTGDVVEARGVLDADDAFVQKPFTITALAAKVRAALAGQVSVQA